MTQSENEIAETTETPETNVDVAIEAVETPESDSESFLKTAPVAFNAWMGETREVMQRHWTQALERARTRLEPLQAVVVEADEVVVVMDEEIDAEEPQTPLHALLSNALVTRAQERGAAILLGSMRALRSQLETLEANLEAARPQTEVRA